MIIAAYAISVLSIAVSAYTVTVSRRSIKRSRAAMPATVVSMDGMLTKENTNAMVEHIRAAVRKQPPDTRTLG